MDRWLYREAAMGGVHGRTFEWGRDFPLLGELKIWGEEGYEKNLLSHFSK